jgi:hypothetical protein
MTGFDTRKEDPHSRLRRRLSLRERLGPGFGGCAKEER